MTTIIKKFKKTRQADYDTLFKKLLTESKNAGYTDLHNFLTKWCNGVKRSHIDPSKSTCNIDSGSWTSANIQALMNKTAQPVVDEKTIIQQARSLGVKVRYNDISTMNLKHYY